MLPATVIAHQRNGATHALVIRVHAEITQQLQRRQGRRPGLSLVLLTPFEVRRKAGTAGPLAVFALQLEQPCTPALSRNASAFSSHDLCRCVNQIAQHLPPNRRIRIKQPPEHVHAAESNMLVSSAMMNGCRRITASLPC